MKKYYVLQIGDEYPTDNTFACGFDYDELVEKANEYAENEDYDGQEIRIVDVDYETNAEEGTEQGFVNEEIIIREGTR